MQTKNKFSTLRKTLIEIQKLQAKSIDGLFFQLDYFKGGLDDKSSIEVKIHHDFFPPRCFSFAGGKLRENCREGVFVSLKEYLDTLNEHQIKRI